MKDYHSKALHKDAAKPRRWAQLQAAIEIS